MIRNLFKIRLKKLLSLVFILIMSHLCVCATGTFNFNSNCITAYNLLLQLRLTEAKAILNQEKISDPQNLIPVFLENYADCILVVANEDATDLKTLLPNKDKRLALLAAGDKNSPWYKYTQAEVNLQWAFAQLKFEQYYDSFFEIKKGYNLLTENKILFPDFKENNKTLGLIHAVIGTVPDNYKWAATILGFGGSITQGMTELKTVIDEQPKSIFYNETMYIYVFLSMHLMNDSESAWKIVSSKGFPDASTDAMACFMKSDVAQHCGYTETTINILSNRNFPKATLNYFFLDYLLGISKLNRLDEDANVPLEKFIAEFKGRNYLKDAYQRTAWYYLMHNDTTKYKYYINFCKTVGATLTDHDQIAKEEAESGIIPNIILLKSRLLCDGGYYSASLAQLSKCNSNTFSAMQDKIEFVYRTARIYHLWNKIDECIPYYTATIEMGKNFPYYYAANAALNLGYIYEQKGNATEAKIYYNQCLAMKNTDYKTSISQKAKAGLNRLEAK